MHQVKALRYFSCSFQTFPDPSRTSGLPFLAEVFATDEGRSLYFVAVNKGSCLREWKGLQEFHRGWRKRGHRFLCMFPDGSTVLSDELHRREPNDTVWSNALMMIRCEVPALFRDKLRIPRAFTDFTVSLHAIDQKSLKPLGRDDTSYQDLPVCQGEWPAYNGTMIAPPTRKYFASLMTRLKLTYSANGVDMKISTSISDVVAWIEYHRMIGFEHFYIFDHDSEEHGVLEAGLMPFIDAGVVTYVWYPYTDCIRDHEVKPGVGPGGYDQLRIGQYSCTNGALRRYAHQTEYMAHWDVDEYMVLPQGKKIQEVVHSFGQPLSDAFMLEEWWYSACHDHVDNHNMLQVEKCRCAVKDSTPAKSLMRTDRVLYFLVHRPHATLSNTVPHTVPMNQSVAFLAHFRQRKRIRFDRNRNVSSSQPHPEPDKLYKWSPILRERLGLYIHALSQTQQRHSAESKTLATVD
eukprot:CAMPEP_0206230584 /NCGR_PEP_ID=MMETSP0047_2-20121206/10344_1 /ASSEMBLY_ACC=CAM_ASM_000192 /TAXON_ID=195065 /ORGANISM="Chroomonas mesostigmatica_cf, Strain CCMP1168" /LENGTH=461 /DNA_ID=CAMNT_0053654031 /DNA_START=208 /DNA_END=1593 /DNA_ORIENTATION=+